MSVSCQYCYALYINSSVQIRYIATLYYRIVPSHDDVCLVFSCHGADIYVLTICHYRAAFRLVQEGKKNTCNFSGFETPMQCESAQDWVNLPVSAFVTA